MLPVAVVVLGTPVSHQSHNKELLRAWQAAFREAAREVWASPPPAADTRLQITICYFAVGRPVRIDNDNMAKPIQDALNGILYRDDSQVTDTTIRRIVLTAAFRLNGSPSFLAAIEAEEDFVYVRLEVAPEHKELL